MASGSCARRYASRRYSRLPLYTRSNKHYAHTGTHKNTYRDVGRIDRHDRQEPLVEIRHGDGGQHAQNRVFQSPHGRTGLAAFEQNVAKVLDRALSGRVPTGAANDTEGRAEGSGDHTPEATKGGVELVRAWE